MEQGVVDEKGNCDLMRLDPHGTAGALGRQQIEHRRKKRILWIAFGIITECFIWGIFGWFWAIPILLWVGIGVQMLLRLSTFSNDFLGKLESLKNITNLLPFFFFLYPFVLSLEEFIFRRLERMTGAGELKRLFDDIDRLGLFSSLIERAFKSRLLAVAESEALNAESFSTLDDMQFLLERNGVFSGDKRDLIEQKRKLLEQRQSELQNRFRNTRGTEYNDVFQKLVKLNLESIDWSLVNWALVDWSSIDWSSIDWSSIDLSSQQGKVRKTIPDLNLTLIGILPGEFQMGSNSGGLIDRVHNVTITQPFWLGQTEVTQAQWQAVMGSSISNQRDLADRSWPLRGEGADYPVYYVSWYDSMAFCRELTEREQQEGRLPQGYEYSLPTEAQWEYACRAGTTGKYAGIIDDMAWYDDNSGNLTHPVAKKNPNDWGLYDMHGNVWEWCLDWYGDYSGYSVTDPTGAPSGSFRVSRGGGWGSNARDCRSADRDGSRPDRRSINLGLRLALRPVGHE
jgi:formylglycine-generating enzyme required for sulfatase activity